MAHLLKVYSLDILQKMFFVMKLIFIALNLKFYRLFVKKTKISMSYYGKKEISNGARICRKSKGYKPQTI